MALKFDKPGRRIEYVLKADRGSESLTIFALRPLTWMEMEEVNAETPFSEEQALQIAVIAAPARAEKRALTQDEMREIEAASPRDTHYMRRLTRYFARAARFSLVEIRGLIDLAGNPTEARPDEFLAHAPVEVLHELGAQAIEISRHSEDIIKK